MAVITRDISRARTSAAVRSAIATGTMADLEKGKRPEPPEDLNAAEAKVWREIVDSMPPDWFSVSTLPILERYCRHTAGMVFIDKTIRELEKKKDPKSLRAWRLMIGVRRRESRLITVLATKMRLTQQSSYTRDSVRPQKEAAARTAAAKSVKRPWG